MNSGKKELDFISSYWSKLDQIVDKFKEDLQAPVTVYGGLRFVNFKDLTDWAPFTFNDTLAILLDKIHYMVSKGRGIDVKPMMVKIMSGRVKHFNHPPSRSQSEQHSEPLGRGHFRWNYNVHTLSKKELQLLNNYFK